MRETTKVSDLIRQGRRQEVWQRFCGFLDLTLPEFMAIQERLLREQLLLVGRSKLGRILMGDDPPQDVEEFRRRVRLTTYEDYAPYLDEKREDVLAEKPVAWAHTSGRSGHYKWVPYTSRAFTKLGEGVLTAVILAAARHRGEVRLEPGDSFVYNSARRPYISGYALYSVAELFDFRFAPSVEETEEMDFQERIRASFRVALRTGIDIIGSISSVLIKVGEQFAEGGANTSGLSMELLHPAVLLRLGRAMISSRLKGRPLLPKDLWRVKGMLVGGTDTGIYRERLKHYWGVEPHEQYGCTEVSSIMSTHAWNRKGLYFFPDLCFYEFIPEAEWARTRADKTYIPQTVLLDEVEVGPRYEIVVTNFLGGPFLRYRVHDLVSFTSLRDEQADIALPSMVFVGRDADLIDLASFTGLIDEKLVWQAVENTGIPYVEWTIRKELLGEHAGLHLYVECEEDLSAEEVADRVNEEMKALNPFYNDLVRFLEIRPLRVTLLSPGTFPAYTRERQAAGADLAHLKPPHMNAPDSVMADLLRLSSAETRST
jgi:hypothetical protein